MKKTRNRYCSFCRKSPTEVGPLVEGPGDVYICGECVELCQSIIEQEKRRHDPLERAARSLADIQARLDQFFSGQLEGKHALADAVFGHYSRMSQMPGAGQNSKNLILLFGPSRASKVLVTRVLAQAMAAPFGQGDATMLQQSSPNSDELRHPLLNLLNASDFDLISAQRGIVYLDGIDQPDADAALFSILANPAIMLGERLSFDTTNILFICGAQLAEFGLSVSEASVGIHELLTPRLSRLLADRIQTIVHWPPLDEETSGRITACVDLKVLLSKYS